MCNKGSIVGTIFLGRRLEIFCSLGTVHETRINRICPGIFTNWDHVIVEGFQFLLISANTILLEYVENSNLGTSRIVFSE